MINSAAFMYIYFRTEALKHSKLEAGVFIDPLGGPITNDLRLKYKETNKQSEILLANLTVSLLKSLKIERFFEFGAAAAYTSNAIAVRYPNINCYAYEANPYHHQYINSLKIHDNLKNLKYINAAISNTTPTVDFKIPICKSTLNDFGGGMLSPDRKSVV